MNCIIPNTDNHSTDLLEVWHGATTPIHVCGFHFTKYDGTQTIYELARVAA